MTKATLNSLGRQALAPFEYTANVVSMIYLSGRAAFFDQAQGLRSALSVVAAQIYFTGVQALPIISVLALASGSIVILQASFSLGRLGGATMLGDLMVAIIVRELAPLLTALIVIARSGTAVTSEIGNMRVNREIEALESMGIHPLSYVVFPRLVGGILSVICLAFYFAAIAIFGGYLATSLIIDIPFAFYGGLVAHAIDGIDVGLFFLKTLFAGSIIFTISCYQGFLVKEAPHEIPQVTTNAVVNSVVYVVLFDVFVTLVYYVSRLGVSW